ncbi:non-structural maintenance of chromosomes element 1 homolog isoform X1 [Podarcis lilfordi]|uniref:Non-structural maintenance of chromosomes element 1 homolog n=1 Tax=Podarcis lilfordi TaxID=74358 RepID=A0AA35L9X3_9SAUR|nr:non-structural maintenance of chromosomes element 1 homolog isoform X1 [Podarcis lilfordi]
MAMTLGTNLNDAHRQFLQAFLTLGFVERPEAAKLHQLYCQLHKVHYVPDKLDDFINTLNGQLQPLSLEIRKGVSEENGRTYYALVNLAETEITLMASDYSENELELFKKTKEGEYTLHLRCVLELEQYILRHYQDSARKCHVCHSLSIQSQVCEDCGIAMHLPCLAKYFQAQREPRCPNCKQFWPHQIPDINLPGPSGLSSTPQETRRSSASPMAQRRQ